MRITLALVTAIAIAAALYSVARDDAPAADTGAVTLVGDSLNVGVEPALRKELRGWTIDAHDRVGRATLEAIWVLEDLAPRLAPVVVVSLGTNDAEGSEAGFRAHVDRALRLIGPRRCVVWATVVRAGEARRGFNAVLRDIVSENSNVELVDWAGMVEADHSLLAGDGVHGTPAGYERRAAATAAAVRACSVE
jgi:lysophospholipase L1-like esterase